MIRIHENGIIILVLVLNLFEEAQELRFNKSYKGMGNSSNLQFNIMFVYAAYAGYPWTMNL